MTTARQNWRYTDRTLSASRLSRSVRGLDESGASTRIASYVVSPAKTSVGREGIEPSTEGL